MDRLIAANTVAIGSGDGPPASGTPGEATDGNPGLGIPATVWSAYQFNAIMAELINLILDAGITLDRFTMTQIRQAIRRMTGRNAAAINSSATLTLDQQGLVLVSAAGGSVVLTLPAASAMGRPIAYTFIRTDAVPGNTVTIQRAGTDTIEAETAFLLPPGARTPIVSDGAALWYRSSLDTPRVTSLTASATLLPAQRGMVLVNATAGAIVITLPAAGAGPNAFTFVRTDASANSVTIQRAGTDTIEGATSAALLALERLEVTADAIGTWRATAEGRFGASFGATGWQKIPNSAGGALILQWGGSRPGDIATADSGNITFPRAFPNACRRVLVTTYGEPTQVSNQVVQLYGAPSTTGFTYGRYEFNVTNTPGAGFEWLAIGD